MGLRVDRTEMWAELLQASRFLRIWEGAFLEDGSHPWSPGLFQSLGWCSEIIIFVGKGS